MGFQEKVVLLMLLAGLGWAVLVMAFLYSINRRIGMLEKTLTSRLDELQKMRSAERYY